MIYLVSQYYSPVKNPPANRLGFIHDVLLERVGPEAFCIVTGTPNYPDGKTYPGYRGKLWQRKTTAGGVKIQHLFEWPAANRGLFFKTLGYVTFSWMAFWYFCLRRMKPDDIVFVTSPPVFQLLALSVLRRFKRFRLVSDIRDLWPEGIAGMGFLKPEGIPYAVLDGMVQAAYRRSAAITGNSSGIVRAITERTSRTDVRLIHNPVDLDKFQRVADTDLAAYRKQHPERYEGARTFAFVGTFANSLGLGELLAAIKQLHGERSDFRFLMMGEGEERPMVEAFRSEHGLEDVLLLFPYTRDSRELVHFIQAADFCFASLRNTVTLRYAIPTKVLEYMASGQPTIAALEGQFAEDLKAASAAMVCRNESGELTALLRDCLDGKRTVADGVPWKFVRERFGADVVRAGFEDLFDSLEQADG